MKNILYDLYYGQVSGWERPFVRTAEFNAVNDKIESEKRYFVNKMSLDDCKRFEDYENLFMVLGGHSQFDAFTYGFKLATQLMCAVFADGKVSKESKTQ